MNRKVATIIGLQAFLIILMFWVIVFYGKDEYEAYTRGEEEEIESPSKLGEEHGVSVVTLSEGVQKQSDILTGPLEAASQQTTLNSYGDVLDIESLIDLRMRYLAARADETVAQASLANSKQEFERLQKLNQDDHNISDRAVLAAQAQYRSDDAKVIAAQTSAHNLSDAIRQQWGDTITEQATATGGALQSLLSYKEVLVRITIPFDAAAPSTGNVLMITPTGSTAAPVKAVYVSRSPITNATLQGRSYLYRASANDLRAGMRVSVALPSSVQSRQGVVIPPQAVVWYSGKAWVYQQIANDKFKREAINTSTETSGGWFDAGHFKAGDRVVLSGAQLLLSEELRYQIKNENED